MREVCPGSNAMTTAGSFSSELRDLYTTESARIREDFSATGNGWAAILQRTAVVEKITLHLWKGIVSPEQEGPQKFALVALGGFGRSWLFPRSDIDLLFLHADHETEASIY